MDADHRNELKENDLTVFLSNLTQWGSRHGLKLLLLVAVVAAVLLVGWRVRSSVSQEHERTWWELTSTSNPDVFRRNAMAYEDPVARALANLRGAEAYNERASLVTDPGAGPDAKNAGADTDRQSDLDYAEAMLANVSKESDLPEFLRLNALLTLAAVKENRNQFSEAGQIYEQVQQGAQSPGYEAIRARAIRRFELLALLRKPVAFGPEPPQPPEPETSLDTESKKPTIPSEDGTGERDTSATTEAAEAPQGASEP